MGTAVHEEQHMTSVYYFCYFIAVLPVFRYMVYWFILLRYYLHSGVGFKFMDEPHPVCRDIQHQGLDDEA
jgi:hypothetical protein